MAITGSQRQAAGRQQGRTVRRMSQTRRTQTIGTQTERSFEDIINEIIASNDYVKMALIMFREYRKSTIFFSLCFAVWYFVDFSNIGYSKALLVLKPELSHESYERTLNVKYIIDMFDHLTSRYKHKEVHVVIIGGPRSQKSDIARQVGQHIYDNDNNQWFYYFDHFLKKKPLNVSILPPPVDVITLNAQSLTKLQHSIEYTIGKFEGKSNGDVSFSKCTGEKGVSDTFLKLKQAFKTRASRPLIIFDNFQDFMYKLCYNSRSYEMFVLHPGNGEYGEIRVIVTTEVKPILDKPTIEYLTLDDGISAN